MNLNANILQSFPQVNENDIDQLLNVEISRNRRKMIVIADDSFGTQTLDGTSVFTDWSIDNIRKGFLENRGMFFILTNSRGMSANKSEHVHQEIIAAIFAVSVELNIPFQIYSRSDSTLRGHYPMETETLGKGLALGGCEIDGEIICPFFKEAGRFTIGNTHYVKVGDELVPCAETEYAKDMTFSYVHSDIPQYVEEKTKGEHKADTVICIPVAMLRACAYDEIVQRLLLARRFAKVCVNAVDYCDLKVFAIAYYRALAKGRHFLIRGAGSLMKILSGTLE